MVILNKDNSAIVESDIPYGVSENKKFLQSELITVLDTTVDYRLKFKINTIDSLGNYLVQFPSGLIEFETKKDSLTVYMKSSTTIDHSKLTNFYLNITSQNNINIVQSNKKYDISKNRDESIRIYISKVQFKKENIKDNLIIKLVH